MTKRTKIQCADTIEQCLQDCDRTTKKQGLDFIVDQLHCRSRIHALKPELRALNAYAAGMRLLWCDYKSEQDDD